jgi:hypothetical protein
MEIVARTPKSAACAIHRAVHTLFDESGGPPADAASTIPMATIAATHTNLTMMDLCSACAVPNVESVNNLCVSLKEKHQNK